MSLPKRDGVHDRYYLIHKPDTSPEVLAEADLCIQDVLSGSARENHAAYPTVVRNHNGTPFLPDQLLERYLTGLPLKGFPCEDAVSLCDAMRRLVGWQEIRYELKKYIEKQVQERCFLVGEREDGFTVFPPCAVRPELRPEDVDEGLLRFACYVAVCHTVYGQSFESLTTEHIFGLVSQNLPGCFWKKGQTSITTSRTWCFRTPLPLSPKRLGIRISPWCAGSLSKEPTSPLLTNTATGLTPWRCRTRIRSWPTT